MKIIKKLCPFTVALVLMVVCFSVSTMTAYAGNTIHSSWGIEIFGCHVIVGYSPAFPGDSRLTEDYCQCSEESNPTNSAAWEGNCFSCGHPWKSHSYDIGSSHSHSYSYGAWSPVVMQGPQSDASVLTPEERSEACAGE